MSYDRFLDPPDDEGCPHPRESIRTRTLGEDTAVVCIACGALLEEP